MLCSFAIRGAVQVCRVCGISFPAGKRIRASCQRINLADAAATARGPCQFLGPQTGLRECTGCRGNVRVKEFACTHAEHVAAGRSTTTYRDCQQCGDYTPVERVEPAAARHALFRVTRGVGDHVQLSVVLQHIQRLHPHVVVDVCTPHPDRLAGMAEAGLCRRVLTEANDQEYDIARPLYWHEPSTVYADSPSTKAEKCLREVFGITPQPELCGYKLACADVPPPCNGPFVLIHYRGWTMRRAKDVDENAIRAVVRALAGHGLTAVILDLDGQSQIDEPNAVNVRADSPLWGGAVDTAKVTGLARHAQLCIGIDSGPGKLFSVSGTPTIIIWRGNHPLHYHGLSESTVHLVPQNHMSLLCGDLTTGLNYFTANYRYRVRASNLGDDLAGLALEQLGIKPPPEPSDSVAIGDGWHVRSHNVGGDWQVIHSVYQHDEYKLAGLPDLPDDALIVDVGAHIGAFARKAHQRWPKAKIVCVEPVAENVEFLRRNVGHFAAVIHAACTYEPQLVLWRSFEPGKSCSTGGSMALPPGEWPNQQGYHYSQEPLAGTVTLEDILRQAGRSRIDLLKLDCEEGEFSILDNTPSLEAIGAIIGEFHGHDRWDALRSRRFGSHWRYNLLYETPARYCGLFQLHNSGPPAVLNRPELYVAVPPGIGDAVWSLMKLPALLRQSGREKCVIGVQGGGSGEIAKRAVPFVERFDFVERAQFDTHNIGEGGTYPNGVYRYYPTAQGWKGYDWLLIANGHLEHGRRLEEWQPQWETDWRIADHFRFTAKELAAAAEFRAEQGPFVLFYLGPEGGNTRSGHNRGELWSPRDWGRLSDMFRGTGRRIVVIGAPYDRPYFDRCRPLLGDVVDCIGQWHIAQTFAVMRQADATVAFQSGLAIFGVYLGCNVASWWRPHGNSQDPREYITFDERMAHDWSPPGAVDSGRYLPQIYGRSTPAGIFSHAQEHWLR